MTIYVKKTFDDLEIKEFKVSRHHTLQNIKWMVKNEWGIAVKHQRLKLKNNINKTWTKHKHKKIRLIYKEGWWSDDCSLEQMGVKNEDTLKLVLNLVIRFSFISFIRLFVYFCLSSCCLRIEVNDFHPWRKRWIFFLWFAVCRCLIHITCKFKFELVNHNFLNFVKYY